MYKIIKKKSFLFSVLALVLVVSLVVGVSTAGKIYAAEKTVRTIASFMDEKAIEYSEVSMDNQVLSVKLLSAGEDRCTLDDVKAIQAIYDTLHDQTIDGKVKNIGIEIYDTNGKLIYDIFENVVSLPVENADQPVEKNDRKKNDMTVNEVLLQVDSIVTEYPYSVQKSCISDADEIAGKKLELTISEMNNDIHSINDIRAIYENLEACSFSTNAINQCEITVVDAEEACVIYMAGDFRYGNIIAWISPAAESAFVAQEGPR